MSSYFSSSSTIFLNDFHRYLGCNSGRGVCMQIYANQTGETSCHPLSAESLQVYCDTGNEYREAAFANHHTG